MLDLERGNHPLARHVEVQPTLDPRAQLVHSTSQKKNCDSEQFETAKRRRRFKPI